MSDSLWSHGLQHTRLPCLSLFPGVCSNSCPFSLWGHRTILCCPLSSCLQSSPASSSFPVNQLLASGGQTIENISYLHYNFLSIFLKIIKINTIQGKYSYTINAGRSTVWMLTCLLSRGGIFHGQSTKLQAKAQLMFTGISNFLSSIVLACEEVILQAIVMWSLALGQPMVTVGHQKLSHIHIFLSSTIKFFPGKLIKSYRQQF